VRYCPYCHSIYTATIDFCGIDGRRLIDREDDPLIGHTVDRYRVLERIACGATGCVYRVEHDVLGQAHAMKVLYGDLGANRKVVERFRREARAIARMDHPNIVRVSDFGTSANGLTFLVMEYVEGKTLKRIIEEEAPLPFARAARLGAQIAAGLAEAHRHGFVHRDVKPSNMLVYRSKAGAERLRILDFGVVGRSADSGDTQITGSGMLVGTPVYMAPEQARHPSEVTAAADVYALGVLLYEMISGAPPFESPKPIDLYIKHSVETPRPLPPCDGLDVLVAWMLAKDPADRPPDADLVEQELLRIAMRLPSGRLVGPAPLGAAEAPTLDDYPALP
jgi:serine/threonine-protein kinase